MPAHLHRARSLQPVVSADLICLRTKWPAPREILGKVDRLIQEAEIRGEYVDEPTFVASDYHLAFEALSSFPTGRICEWGCGLGVVVGMASLLGWDAVGIEQNRDLADMARQLHTDFGLWTEILDGDLFYSFEQADLYYAYMWPDLVEPMQEHFATHAPPGARLLLHDACGRMELFMREGEADS